MAGALACSMLHRYDLIGYFHADMLHVVHVIHQLRVLDVVKLYQVSAPPE